MRSQLERLDRTLVSSGSALEFYRDTVRLPDGKLEQWDFVHHKKGGGACAVPVLPDGRILMIRQGRPSVDQEMLELPAGARNDPEEDAAVTAARELREETGYRAGKLTFLAHLVTAPAYCDETTDLFLAEELVPDGEQILDEAEDIRLEPHALPELMEMIAAGRITDAKTVAGLCACAAHLAGR